MNEPIHSMTSEVTNPSSKEISDFLLAEYAKLRAVTSCVYTITAVGKPCDGVFFRDGLQSHFEGS
jgi:hypothetical protein